MIDSGTDQRPGWLSPAREHPAPSSTPAAGSAVTGMAHGIAGPLALLAVAERAGRSVPGQRRALTNAADWLVRRHTEYSWPPWIDGDRLRSGTGPVAAGRRDAWCYGAPGIARALELTASVLPGTDHARTARGALSALAARPADTWDTTGSGLCHGSAGVLQCALRAREPRLAGSAADHTVRLLREQPLPVAPRPNLPSTEAPRRHVPSTAVPHRPEDPGFLTGSAGAALALAHYAGLLPEDVAAPWDCLLSTV
jgi:hypothetical protein